MTRALAVLLAAVLLVGLVVAGVVLLRDDGPSRVAAPDVPAGASADELARLSCTRLRSAAQQVRVDGDALAVRTELAAARRLAGEALREDGRYAPLSGAVAALDEAVRTDDPQAAGTALQVALQACGPL